MFSVPLLDHLAWSPFCGTCALNIHSNKPYMTAHICLWNNFQYKVKAAGRGQAVFTPWSYLTDGYCVASGICLSVHPMSPSLHTLLTSNHHCIFTMPSTCILAFRPLTLAWWPWLCLLFSVNVVFFLILCGGGHKKHASIRWGFKDI